MADFCKQCSIEMFGKDTGDLKGLTQPEEQARGMYAVVICEGCGVILVDTEGACVSADCLEHHGKMVPNNGG